jgi:integrase
LARRTKGEGSIYWSRSEKTWIAEITLPDGRRKKKRAKDKQVVQDWIFEQRKAIKENKAVPDDKITFGQFADKFLKEVASHTLKASTYSSYETMLRVHIVPEIGRIKLAALKPQDLQGFYSRKLDGGLSKKSVKYLHAITRRILNEAVKKGLIYNNPCNQVTPPKIEKKPPKVWTIEQAQTFLSATAEHRWYGIYLIALTTGARRGEILGMEWENINWQNGTITIDKAVSEIEGHAVITEPKTSYARRTIKLPEVVLELLSENKEDEGLIFKSKTGTPITPRNLLRHYHSVLETLDIPKIRFHDLRHTAATILLKQDTHPVLVKELLGHSSITTTLDVYSHVLPPMKSEVADKMDSVFK